MTHQAFMAPALLRWYHGTKRELPWRQTRDPYCIWISEIMLQQTRVETVKGYYQRFLELFPTVFALAAAPQQEVLKAWEGLGYYSRARNLQKAAREIVDRYGGTFPHTYEALKALPGIGAYTAGAIASISFGEAVPAVDGNVLRVASRYFGVREDVGSPAVQRRIRGLVAGSLPPDAPGDYNQALMELGATVCLPGAPKCDLCPWQASCDAYAEQDAHLLPLHMKKPPPRPVEVAVCLLTWEGRIVVTRRTQRLLQGLYVFTLVEGETNRERVRQSLAESGLACSLGIPLGTARHVFTHRVWEMRLLHCPLAKKPEEEILAALQARLVTREELLALPLPTAMKAAKEAALELNW